MIFITLCAENIKTIINKSHIPPTKKKIGASLKSLIENIFLVIGIRPIDTNIIPERYAIQKNKGYGTAIHMKAIGKYGITEWHRKSFKPCSK